MNDMRNSLITEDMFNHILGGIKRENNKGQRYLFEYKNLFTHYDLTKNKKAMALISNLLKEIADYTTIIESQGEGLYKDLVTGKIIVCNGEIEQHDSIFNPMSFDSLLEKTDDENPDLSEEDKEKIQYYYNFAELVYVDALLGMDLNPDLAKEVQSYKKKLDEERIGTRYVIKYDDIKMTLDYNNDRNFHNKFKSYLLHNLKSNYIGSNYTIIEYLGDDLYKDLTSGMIITQKRISPSFKQEGERINYNEISNQDYLFKHPVSIDIKSLEPTSDELLYKIGKRTLPNAIGINDCLEKTLTDVELEYSRVLEEIKLNEFLRQHAEASDTYEKDKTLKKVRMYYNL